MYNKVEYITLTCDDCGDTFKDEIGIPLYTDKDQLIKDAAINWWYAVKNYPDKHICPNCSMGSLIGDTPQNEQP